jgi:hypothetical protein
VSGSGGSAVVEAARPRIDRPVLVSNAISGALWIIVALLPWNGADYDWSSLPLALVPTAYVAGMSWYLGSVYGRDALTVAQEAVAWIVPWLVGVALWSVLTVGLMFVNTPGHWAGGIAWALAVATPCYLAWQVVALVIRQLLSSRAPTPVRR